MRLNGITTKDIPIRMLGKYVRKVGSVFVKPYLEKAHVAVRGIRHAPVPMQVSPSPATKPRGAPTRLVFILFETQARRFSLRVKSSSCCLRPSPLHYLKIPMDSDERPNDNAQAADKLVPIADQTADALPTFRSVLLNRPERRPSGGMGIRQMRLAA